jgi:hypothetical protein
MTEAARIEAVRQLNRFYTRVIGVLREGCSTAPSRWSRRASSTSWRTARPPRPARSPEIWDDSRHSAGIRSRSTRGSTEDPFSDTRSRSATEAGERLVSLTRQGLLRVDVLLPRFFLPQHVGIRYT